MSITDDPPIGSDLAGYRLESVLGRGGMSVVYLAEDLRLKRKVAVKLLASALAADAGFRERFLAESQLAASIDHPNIVPIYEAGEADGRLFIAMRYVEGDDLAPSAEASGALEPAEAVALVAQVAAALDAAHAHGLVHRDVKPSNALIARPRRRGRRPRLPGRLRPHRQRPRRPPSPPRPASPARSTTSPPSRSAASSVDGRADLYALGCVLYECLAGTPPFARPTEVATIYAHLEEPPPPPAPPARAAQGDRRRPRESAREEPGRPLSELPRAHPRRPRRARDRPPPPQPLAARHRGRRSRPDRRRPRRLHPHPQPRHRTADPTADTLLRIDPTTNTSRNGSPSDTTSGVAVGGGHVWVTNLADGTISLVDPATGKVRTIAGQGAPTGIAVAAGSAVVADGTAHSLTAFDATTGTPSFKTTLRGPSNGTLQIAGGTERDLVRRRRGGIAGKVDDTLTVGTPSSASSRFRPTPRASSPPTSRSPAWRSARGDLGRRRRPGEDRLATRIRTTGRALAIPLAFVPGAIAAGSGAVWVTSLLDDTVSRIDPASNRITATIHVGRGVAGIAAGEGGVWVASSFDDTVSRIDPLTNRVVARIPVGGTPNRSPSASAGSGSRPEATPIPAPRGSITIGVLSDCEGTFGLALPTTTPLPRPSCR